MSAAFGIDLDEFRPDFFLKEGTLSLDGLELKILHTPGHSPGSVVLYWPVQKALFTGDLVFKEGVGRTDLPGGDGTRLKQSIKGLVSLDVEWLLPGHGEIIQGAGQVQKNFKEIEEFWFSYV
jgi:glyoxylase-like metal-dependent hydrolase (beta-lactamase superfamily II)